MKRIVVILCATLLPSIALAGAPVNIAVSVDVPSSCSATDTDGVVHPYEGYLAICALEAAKDAGALSDIQLSNQYPAFGLFVTALNTVVADPNSQYWALYQNGNYASLGLTSLPVIAGDVISLNLHDFSDADLGSSVTLTIRSLKSTPSVRSVGAGGYIIHTQPVERNALNYLNAAQHADGSFGADLLTDWAALAYAATDADTTALSTYLRNESAALSSVTDYERHAMALESLGINPYSGSPIDTITPIVQAFDGTQIGNPSFDNDDIFALFPLLHAGYTTDDEIIRKVVAFILSRQNKDGSWDESVDMTAAAIQALAPMRSTGNIATALFNAEDYLRSQQKVNGGFSNSFATSWVLQAIAALGESTSQWEAHGTYLNPNDSLAALQQADGGIEATTTSIDMRTWATAYALPAMHGRTWNSLLISFTKPATPLEAEPATSPLPVATSTGLTATTTATTTIAVQPIKKVAVSARRPKESVASTTQDSVGPQTAAVASAAGSHFFGNIWDSVVSFFSRFI